MTQDEIADTLRSYFMVDQECWERSFGRDYRNYTSLEYRAYRKERERKYEALREHLRHSPDEAVFGALFPVACSWEPLAIPSDLAGILLFDRNPVCPLPARDAVRAVALSKWNLSLEEVPWYLARRFGPEVMHHAIREVESDDYFQGLKPSETLGLRPMSSNGPCHRAMLGCY